MEKEYETFYCNDSKKLIIKCIICDLICDTVTQFDVHKMSKKHIKKSNDFKLCNSVNSASSNSSGSLGSPQSMMSQNSSGNEDCETVYNMEAKKMVVKCKICGIYCDTMKQFEVHKASLNHTKKAEKLKLLNDYITKSPVPSPEPSTCSQLLFNQNVPMMSTPKAGEFTQSMFYCRICNVNCNNGEQLKAHESGKSHQKKALKHEYQNWDKSKIPQTQSLRNDTFTEESNNIGPKSPVIEDKKESSPVKKDASFDMNSLLTPLRTINSVTCRLCDVTMNTDEQFEMHCNGTRHKRKMKNHNIVDPDMITKVGITQIGDNDFEFCDACEIKIHSNNMESHKSGKTHKENSVKMRQVLCSSDKMVKKIGLTPGCQHFENLLLNPREYQTEVYEKSLKSDCVIFLPTGTGKTLVASMIILKMLEENPHHRVAFLVDKVLLVMQQNEFFSEQYTDICMKRFKDKGSTEDRKLRVIGLANCYVNTPHAFSVRDHDMVVATSELFRGLLTQKKLFWEEFCLIILDEAHHCVKDHPYNKLLREYHIYPQSVLINKTDIHVQIIQNENPDVDKAKMIEWKNRRCKIVGLTASPAGELDKEKTYELLMELLKSLGGVNIVNVTENKVQLEEFTSNSDIEPRLVNYSENESKFRDMMKYAFFFLVGKFERFITLSRNLVVSRDNRNLTVEDVADFRGQLLNRLQETQNVQKTTINHVLSVLDLIDAVDTFGYKVAWTKLKELMENENEKVWFKDNTICFVEPTEKMIEQPAKEDSSVIQEIIKEAKMLSGESRTILVLVRERQTARELEVILKAECAEQQLILLVGHGAGKKSKKGMTVAKQKKALTMIKERKNQIIVATSVADEGIDLPDCDLVILINPPNSVQALVQVRGRARKKSSRLLMICRDQESIDELRSLQEKETNIIEAIDRILAQS